MARQENRLGEFAMRRRALLGFVAAAIGAGLAPRAAAQRPAVRVTREDPVVTRTDFDPRRPPPDMPPLAPPESGVCKTTFELSAGVTYSAERLKSGTARIYVDGLEIVTKLRIDIFTVQNAPPKLRAHEEGHRAIAEHYFERSATIAEDIGRRLIGTSYDGLGADDEAAQRDAFAKVIAEIERAYMARVRVPSAAANERFDEITRHGLEPIEESEAVARAIAAP
jgi:hypothetical protein